MTNNNALKNKTWAWTTRYITDGLLRGLFFLIIYFLTTVIIKNRQSNLLCEL